MLLKKTELGYYETIFTRIYIFYLLYLMYQDQLTLLNIVIFDYCVTNFEIEIQYPIKTFIKTIRSSINSIKMSIKTFIKSISLVIVISIRIQGNDKE